MLFRGSLTLALTLTAALGCGGERSDGHEPREPGAGRRQAPASAPRLGLPVEAAAAVFEAPAEEPELDARLEALRQRWYRAADRGAPDAALVEIEQFVFDADPEVSALAEEALEDLLALREGRREQPLSKSRSRNRSPRPDPRLKYSCRTGPWNARTRGAE